MARKLYISDAIAQVTSDDGDFGPVTAAMTVWDAYTGGTQQLDLQQVLAGTTTPVTTVTPQPPTYQIIFNGPDAYIGSLWIEGPDGVRRLVNPTDLADRTSGVSSIAVNGGSAQTGAVALTVPSTLASTSISDSTTIGRSVVTAATQAAARSAIAAAGTTDLTTTLNGLTDVDTSEAFVDNVLTAQDDGTFAFATIPSPDGYIPILTKNEGDADPAGVGFFVATLAGAGTSFGYGTVLGGHGVTNATTDSITLTAPVAAGTLIVLGVSSDGTGAVLTTWTAADSKANTYVQVVNHLQGSANQSALLRCRVTTALAIGDTITVTASETRNNICLVAATATGTANPAIDKSVTNGAATTTTPVVGPTTTLAQTDEIAFAVFGFTSGTASQVFAANGGNGWVQAGATVESSTSSGRRAVAMVYKVVTSTAAVTADGTITPGSIYSACLATFKKA